MSDNFERLIASFSPEKRKLLGELLQPVPDPIAIVGMACRFPGGVDSPEAFWRLLHNGGDAVREVPADRWNIDEYYDPDASKPGKMCTRKGAFLDQVDQFDALFFGIAPREAGRMDPQQRLLLEVTWEALEHAGLPAERLAGSETGVFAGITTTDYWWLQVPDIMNFDGHAGMGGAHCIATGRISHLFDFRGPNVAIDTACSSSLVAVHLACQSLRNGECNVALAGGVNVMVAPLATVFLSKWGALSPDGHCRTFDASANGFARGEGCGMVVLKRLSDAVADGDRVLAVIRGSAINQDGHGTRLSAPNGLAQQAVVRKALANAGVSASQISYVETHGTGTPLGDPIEVEALTTALGGESAGGRCALGSVKANIGHLEAAAGVAGLMKAVLCLQHRTLPPQIHLTQLNPRIALEGTRFFIPQQGAPWPQDAGLRLAGVSSFGLSGTNAHVVVEEYPPAVPASAATSPAAAYLLPLSARSPAALKAWTQDLRKVLAAEGGDAVSPDDVCYTAAVRRSHHPYRWTAAGRNRDELVERLDALIQDPPAVHAAFAGDVPKLAFVFSGQGSQWARMGCDLLDGEPLFRERIEQCDAVLRRDASWSLIDELRAEEPRSRLGRTEIAQPAIFAVQAALVGLYRSWGIVPEAVIGHSAGEVAAAYVAGVLSLEDSLRIVYHRARLMQRAAGRGRMAAVGLSSEEAAAAIANYDGQLSVAALNGPGSTVLSGEPAALQAVLQSLQQRDVFCRDLGVDYAFHSRQMEPVLTELERSIAGVTPHAAALHFVSTVTGELVQGEELQADHWLHNVRQPVRFADGIRRLLDDEYRVFLEVGPHPVLATPMTQCLQERNAEGTILASLRQGQPGQTCLFRAAGALYAAGWELAWPKLLPQNGKSVQLPQYPWQRKRHWISTEPTAKPAERSAAAAIATATPDAPATPPAAAAGDDGRVSSYYDRVSQIAERENQDDFLTFAPFRQRVAGFSWLRAFHEPERYPEQCELIRQAQLELRRVLFRGIDFSAIRNVLDFGCGYSSDLLALAGQHRHLQLDGYTISSKQAEIGNRKARTRGLDDRLSVFHRNSCQDDFPRQYDLVFGFEVAHYIRDKHALFSNVARHLNDGGFVVLADFVANTVSDIEHEATSSYIITSGQWSELLAQHKLRVVECVDVSLEMSNFLHDGDAERNLAELETRFGNQGDIRSHYSSYDGLGKLFQKKLATYGLITIQKDRYLTKEEIVRINRDKLSAPTPYGEVVQRDGLRAAAAAVTESPGTPRPDFSNWLYEIQWQAKPLPKPLAELPTSACQGSWLIFADQGGLGSEVANVLRRHGATCVTVSPGESYRAQAGHFQVNASRPEDFRELLADALAPEMPDCRGVLYLWGLDGTPPQRTTLHSLEAELSLGCGGLLHLAQALSAVEWSVEPKLWIATRGAQPADDSSPVALGQGPLWGMGRTIAAELPGIWGGLIDLEPAVKPVLAANQLVEQLAGGDGEDQVAFRQGQRHVARLAHPGDGAAATRPVGFREDASYLITGGLGDLGLEAARWMVGRGARHLVLLQRSGLPPRPQWGDIEPGSRTARQMAAVQRLEARGAKVHVFAVDAAQEDQLARVLAEVRQSLPPLKGVLHAAGLLDDGILAQLNPDRLRRVTAPKISGAWNLHRLTLSDPLDFFVMFSSAASVFGSPGQANYAAANAGLDALAHYRAQQELPALSINWGPWSEVGMAAAAANRGQRVSQIGIGSIAPDQGVLVLEQLILQPRAQVAAVALDLDQLRQAWPAAAKMPLLAELSGESVLAPCQPAETRSEGTEQKPPLAVTSPIRQTLTAAEPAARRPLLERYLVDQAAKVLHLSASDLDLRRPLNSMGIDSLMAVELRNRLESDLAMSVPLVTLLEGSSLADLAAKVLSQLPAAASEPGSDRVTRAMIKLDELSDEAVKALLAEKKQRARSAKGVT